MVLHYPVTIAHMINDQVPQNWKLWQETMLKNLANQSEGTILK